MSCVALRCVAYSSFLTEPIAYNINHPFSPFFFLILNWKKQKKQQQQRRNVSNNNNEAQLFATKMSPRFFFFCNSNIEWVLRHCSHSNWVCACMCSLDKKSDLYLANIPLIFAYIVFFAFCLFLLHFIQIVYSFFNITQNQQHHFSHLICKWKWKQREKKVKINQLCTFI